MNLTHVEARSYADILWAEVGLVNEVDVIVIPPFTAIPALAESLNKKPAARLGAQNMYWEKHGAFTGEISAAMLTALNVDYVVIGHSERRRLFGETDEAQETQAFIRSVIASISDQTVAAKVRIQYGGSVKPDNAKALLQKPDIDGALVGGASLDPRGFVQIIRSAVAVAEQQDFR